MCVFLRKCWVNFKCGSLKTIFSVLRPLFSVSVFSAHVISTFFTMLLSLLPLLLCVLSIVFVLNKILGEHNEIICGNYIWNLNRFEDKIQIYSSEILRQLSQFSIFSFVWNQCFFIWYVETRIIIVSLFS